MTEINERFPCQKTKINSMARDGRERKEKDYKLLNTLFIN